MRGSIHLILSVLVLACAARATRAVACGPDPCAEFGAGVPDTARVFAFRPDDGPSWRLRLLLQAYLGREAVAAMAAGGDEAGPGLADYRARVERYFVERSLAMPALVAREQPWSWWFCTTNTYATALEFLAALEAEPALGPHAARLVAWRTRLVGVCTADSARADSVVLELRAAAAAEPPLAEAAAYLEGAALLHSGRALGALTAFERLREARNPWLRETARYLRGRCLLIAAQRDWDGWNEPARIDRALLARSSEAFGAYLAAHPSGRYAESARGLSRRLHLLAGESGELTRECVARFGALLAARRYDEIGRSALVEVAAYLPLATLGVGEYPWDEPLVAAADLSRARRVLAEPGAALARLAASRPAYAAYPGLYELVRLTLLVAAGSAEALDVAPPAAAPPAVRWSMQPLRAMALERAGRLAEARQTLRDLALAVPRAAQEHRFVADLLRLHLAAGDFADAFADGSPFADSLTAALTFAPLLSDSALAGLPERPGSAGSYAARVLLLYRHLHARRYAAFLALHERLGRPEPFTEVETAARTLAGAPDDPKALFNLGYFLQVREDWPTWCCACEYLTTGPPAFALPRSHGDPPIAFYLRALERLETAGDPELEPKVLHQAILCFKESNSGFACLREAADIVPPETRAAWFKRLKAQYAKSPWAAKTPYWY
jgi:hypothetical protein